jgi:hypothetical protein
MSIRSNAGWYYNRTNSSTKPYELVIIIPRGGVKLFRGSERRELGRERPDAQWYPLWIGAAGTGGLPCRDECRCRDDGISNTNFVMTDR